MNTTVQNFTPCMAKNKAAFGILNDELEQLMALAYALRDRLEPTDPENPPASCDLTSWRLTEVMVNILESASTTRGIKNLLLGEPLTP